jgi:hypothetical protein
MNWRRITMADGKVYIVEARFRSDARARKLADSIGLTRTCDGHGGYLVLRPTDPMGSPIGKLGERIEKTTVGPR